LAGTLGIPGVALCGPTSGVRVFDWYDSIRGVGGALECSPCYWKTERGYHRACETQCDALAQISIEEVVRLLDAVVTKEVNRQELFLDYLESA